MAEVISAKVGQGIFLVFLHLLALRNSSSESFDAGHVRYPFPILTLISSEAVVADVHRRQCLTSNGDIYGWQYREGGSEKAMTTYGRAFRKEEGHGSRLTILGGKNP